MGFLRLRVQAMGRPCPKTWFSGPMLRLLQKMEKKFLFPHVMERGVQNHAEFGGFYLPECSQYTREAQHQSTHHQKPGSQSLSVDQSPLGPQEIPSHQLAALARSSRV